MSGRRAHSDLFGEITVPSGVLVVLDCGVLPLWNHELAAKQDQEAGELAFAGRLTAGLVSGLPTHRALPVCGTRMAGDEFPENWRSVEVRLQAEYAESRAEQFATVAVDCARLIFADREALRSWRHEETSDGLADYVFWGLHAEEMAGLVEAPNLGSGEFGWENLPIERAAELGQTVERFKVEKGLRLAGDFRPHSHHYAILKQMRASKTGSGTLELSGAKLCAFFTSWGDGFFPLFRVFEGDQLVAVRLKLGTEAARENMRRVNR